MIRREAQPVSSGRSHRLVRFQRTSYISRWFQPSVKLQPISKGSRTIPNLLTMESRDAPLKKKMVLYSTFWYLFRLALPKIVTKKHTHFPPPPALQHHDSSLPTPDSQLSTPHFFKLISPLFSCKIFIERSIKKRQPHEYAGADQAP